MKGISTVTILKKLLFLAPFVAILMALSAPSASADPVSFNLTSDHCTGGCGPAGTIFGTVSVTQNGANVDVTVHLNSPFVWAKTGSADFMAFKFNAPGVPMANVTVDQTFGGQTLAVLMGIFNGDGTGNFFWGIECQTCGNGISTINSNIVFHVANSTEAVLTTVNNLGNVFVVDIGNPTNGNTGPIDATTPTTTPEPSSLITLGFAVLGLGLATRRLKL